MRYYWETAKNEWPIRHRKISFEDIVWAIAQGRLVDVLISGKERYKGQTQLVVEVKGYAYLIPVAEEGEMIILKTIIPSRKLTRQYLRKGGPSHGTHES